MEYYELHDIQKIKSNKLNEKTDWNNLGGMFSFVMPPKHCIVLQLYCISATESATVVVAAVQRDLW